MVKPRHPDQEGEDLAEQERGKNGSWDDPSGGQGMVGKEITKHKVLQLRIILSNIPKSPFSG